MLVKSNQFKHKFDRTYVVNKFVSFDEQHVLLVGNDSHISFFNLETMFFNGSMKIDFTNENLDIYDIQFLD